MEDVKESREAAAANLLGRFYRGLFFAATLAVGGACVWALWNEWLNPWHDEHLRSTAIAAVLLAATGVAAWKSDSLYELLRRQPAWSFVPATIAMAAIWIDGSQGSELFIVSLILLGPVAVATDARWTLAVAAYLTVGYLIGLMAVNSWTWSELEEIDQADTELQHLFAYVPVALLFVWPLERGASYVARSNQIVEDERRRLEQRLRRAKLEARAMKLAAGGAATAAAAVDGSGPPRVTDELSAREIEVCQLVAEGLSNNEIAERLYLSPRTVQSHIAHAMRKTEAKSRTQLAIFMVRDGLVPDLQPASERSGS